MPDPQDVVEAFDCNYNIGTAVRCLLEHAQGVDLAAKAHPSLYMSLRHLLLELRRLEPRWSPDNAAQAYVVDMDSALRSVVAELRDVPDNEAVLAIKGLLISAVRNTLEDLVDTG